MKFFTITLMLAMFSQVLLGGNSLIVSERRFPKIRQEKRVLDSEEENEVYLHC
jgi:hypothetical protein